MNIDMQMINDTIEDLKSGNSCEVTASSSTDETITIAESNPSEQLGKFISYLYENNLLDLNYPDNNLLCKDKNITDLTKEEVLTRLTSIIREDKFCSGLLSSKVKDGTILNLVERLKELG